MENVRLKSMCLVRMRVESVRLESMCLERMRVQKMLGKYPASQKKGEIYIYRTSPSPARTTSKNSLQTSSIVLKQSRRVELIVLDSHNRTIPFSTPAHSLCSTHSLSPSHSMTPSISPSLYPLTVSHEGTSLVRKLATNPPLDAHSTHSTHKGSPHYYSSHIDDPHHTHRPQVQEQHNNAHLPPHCLIPFSPFETPSTSHRRSQPRSKGEEGGKK